MDTVLRAEVRFRMGAGGGVPELCIHFSFWGAVESKQCEADSMFLMCSLETPLQTYQRPVKAFAMITFPLISPITTAIHLPQTKQWHNSTQIVSSGAHIPIRLIPYLLYRCRAAGLLSDLFSRVDSGRTKRYDHEQERPYFGQIFADLLDRHMQLNAIESS